MDLTFQVPMQYCSLQHWTLLLSPVTSTAGCCFSFGSIPSFFLELFLHWSPVVCWAPTDLGSSSFSILSFCLFILFMGFSRQETEVVCHFLLQGIFPTQGSNPSLLHCRQTVNHLSHQGSSIQSTKTRPGADCGLDHELLIAKFRLKLKKVGKITRPFRYDLNQIPYDYTVEVRIDLRA